MNESLSEEPTSDDPTAEELYTEYKTAYQALVDARRIIPDPDEDMSLKITEMETKINSAILDTATRQEMLAQLIRAKDISMGTRIAMQQMNVAAAEAILKMTLLGAEGVYERHRDEWYEEALIERAAYTD